MTGKKVDQILNDVEDHPLHRALDQAQDYAKRCGVSPAPEQLIRLIAALLILSDEVVL